MIDDPYKILGVSPDASDEEVKRAYRRLAKQYHPDLHPGDENAAKMMQKINAAYEQIKNPEKAQQSRTSQSYSGYGYDPFGGAWQRQSYAGASGDQYQQSAYQYIVFRRYHEALNVLQNCANRNARWYYLSALANNGMGNQVTAMEHIRRAVSMDPDNLEYQSVLNRMEYGGTAYRQQAGNFRGFTMGGDPCTNLCLCYLFNIFCCGGRGMFLCC
jgi:molecular chaperone DnaJ